MARIRSIKPSFFSHEELSALDAQVHLLAAGLLCYADDEGYFHAHPKLVQAAIFPIREIFQSIPEMLRSLHAVGYVDIGSTEDGKMYGKVRNFAAHQRVSHPTPSIIKTLQITWDDSGIFPEDSVKAPESFRPEGNRRELNGKEEKPSRKRATKTAISDERHTAFKSEVEKYWDSKNKGVPMPWGPAEGKQLGMFLREAPHITLEQFTGFLRARYRSDVNHGERPCQWLKWITGYGNGPIDRYGKPIQEGTNGASKPDQQSAASKRVHNNRLAVAKYAVERGWITPEQANREGDTPVAEPGPSGDDGGIHGGLREVSGEVLPPAGRGSNGKPAHRAETELFPDAERDGSGD